LNGCSREWSDEQAQKVLDSNIFRRVLKSINVSGGEPTMWDALLDFLPLVRKQNKNAILSITTNALRLSNDKPYFERFIKVCSDNSIDVNVSWHDDNSALVPLYILHQENLLRDIYVSPKSVKELSSMEEMFHNFQKEHKATHWNPIIVGENKISTGMKLLDFLKNREHVLGRTRIVNDKRQDNMFILQNSLDGKFSYKEYQCKCGRNGVIFTNVRLYHCLSQALKMYKPLSLMNEEHHDWIKCSMDRCYGYNFDLKK
jgi:organic radical activating enzyme